MKHLEVEFKYRADNITLSAFTKFCQKLKPKKVIFPAGYDYFYQKAGDQNSFCRYRAGLDLKQLTFKKKTTDNNNYVRTEHNLDLTDSSEEQITAFCKDLGYNYSFSLYKICFVYVYEWYTLVYYICYDSNMKELGRFVEIEMKEDHAWIDEKAVWNELVVIEKLGKPIGLLPQCRVKKSLFELYKP